MLQNKLIFGITLLLGFGLSGIKAQTEPAVKDADGNVYKTVTIGKQVWMAENLKTTKYNDGTVIPLVTDSNVWANFETIGYCWYQNNNVKFKNPYGALYNWRTVSTGKLCPTGWHVPANTDWTILINYLGDSTIAGGKLKESGTKHWSNPNTGATNVTGFTALPGGARNFMGSFSGIGEQGYWWSATEINEGTAWCLIIYYNASLAVKSNLLVYKTMGLSVRCVKD